MPIGSRTSLTTGGTLGSVSIVLTHFMRSVVQQRTCHGQENFAQAE
jgi:hypothetical protein